jgi:hypothetical protein
MHNAGPAFGPRPRPAWLGPVVEAAHSAQVDGARPGAHTTVTAHRPLVAVRQAWACRRRFLSEVFMVSMRTTSGWHRAMFCGWGLTRWVRRRWGGPGRLSRLAMRGSGDRQLASFGLAASHEKGEHLGTVDGGKGWSAAGITRMARRQSRGPAVGKTSNTGGSRQLRGHGGLEEHEGACANPLGSSVEDGEWGVRRVLPRGADDGVGAARSVSKRASAATKTRLRWAWAVHDAIRGGMGCRQVGPGHCVWF